VGFSNKAKSPAKRRILLFRLKRAARSGGKIKKRLDKYSEFSYYSDFID
jgi:hypothetical protein